VAAESSWTTNVGLRGLFTCHANVIYQTFDQAHPHLALTMVLGAMLFQY
jgi:hypothetical protein